ncbi:MAG: class I SAM-dependent methyltransferase [bacterium]
MNTKDAVSLLATAVSTRGGTWADVGAGEGTFTRALAELLGVDAHIYAIDRDADAIAELSRSVESLDATIIPVIADFSRSVELPNRGDTLLDGMLFANALHFVRDADAVLARLARWLRPGGSVVIVEYDRRAASQWVPYPIPLARLAMLAHAAGLSAPIITATRPSSYGGNLYVAQATYFSP